MQVISNLDLDIKSHTASLIHIENFEIDTKISPKFSDYLNIKI